MNIEMNILKIFTAIIISTISQYLEIKWHRRPVYISKLITDNHKEDILNAMNQLGLEETENKKENHIRVEYSNFNGGGIEMVAATDYDGFYIYETIIGINRLLNSNSFQCVALHELSHSLSLAHQEEGIMRPIINTTDHYCHLSYVDHLLIWQNLLD
jgi:hypothetical protein